MMSTTVTPEGCAIVYCEGMFNTPSGKTAHGLVRFTRRYQVLAVIDSRHAGMDAGAVLDGKAKNIPVFKSLEDALTGLKPAGTAPTHFVVGCAPDGGRLRAADRIAVRQAISNRLHVDCGLHDFLTEDADLLAAAAENGVRVRDIRKPPPIRDLHFFSGKIEQVHALKIAVLGTDSAVGKRTTAWIIANGCLDTGISAHMVGTGQTAWMQGAKHGIILDSLINDFVSGEIEHAVYEAWQDGYPEVIVIEGQGSLMNPAYPGGFEILAAARPDLVVLQHAPARVEYDGFPGYPIQPLKRQIEAIEMLSGKPVTAVTINHEGMKKQTIEETCRRLESSIGLPVSDVLLDGPDALLTVLKRHLRHSSHRREELRTK